MFFFFFLEVGTFTFFLIAAKVCINVFFFVEFLMNYFFICVKLWFIKMLLLMKIAGIYHNSMLHFSSLQNRKHDERWIFHIRSFDWPQKINKSKIVMLVEIISNLMAPCTHAFYKNLAKRPVNSSRSAAQGANTFMLSPHHLLHIHFRQGILTFFFFLICKPIPRWISILFT